MAVNINERKMQNCVKRGHMGVIWPTFEILGPLLSGRRL